MGQFMGLVLSSVEYAIFGHVMRAHPSLEKDIILGITAEARKKAPYAVHGRGQN